MITEIGIVAGEIWHFLDKNGEVDFTTLKNGIGRDEKLVFMSLGWLAREGHILLSQESEGYKISLRRR